MVRSKYEGEALQEPKQISNQEEGWQLRLAPYFPSERLVQSVQLAMILKRPLLLKGEPGCGKTKLAQAVAYELYGDHFPGHYFEWYVKSSSKAQDGLYTFDHVQRLRDAQLKGEVGDLKSYRRFGPLGRAFIQSTPEKPAILLIDEVDKADIDFPNDLLLELDQRRFFVEETGEEITAQEPPIIFITSNDEKDLPPAFLRRCLFHYIEFPDIDTMRYIVRSNFPDLNSAILEKSLQKFEALRRAMKNDPNTEKTASTSELLDWIRVINHFQLEGIDLEKDLTDNQELIYNQALLKSLNDYKRHARKDR